MSSYRRPVFLGAEYLRWWWWWCERRSSSSSVLWRRPNLSTWTRRHPHHPLLPNGAVPQQQQRFLGVLIDPALLSSSASSADDSSSRPQKKRSKSPSYRFVDQSRLRVLGGTGGKGSLSMMILKRKHRIRPDGGHGGRGGSVIVVADPTEQTLRSSHPHLQAEHGTNGTSQECSGRSGKNLVVRVPCGVVVKRVLNYYEIWEEETRKVRKRIPTSSSSSSSSSSISAKAHEGDDDGNGHWQDDDEDDVDVDPRDLELLRQGFEIDVFPEESAPVAHAPFDDDDTVDAENHGSAVYSPADHEPSEKDVPHQQDRHTVVLADLDTPGSYVVVARGGRGGLGTCIYASEHGPLPEARVLIQNAKPEPGEVAFLELELKLIADVGLVGFPNAGKSSLLRALSRASPAVAPYPFTTLHPFIGCVEYSDGLSIKVADIPGLIDGASEGRGRGHDFLRHIERTKALLYLVDAAGVDFRDPVQDLHVLANELASYGDGTLLERRALVVANKMDLVPKEMAPEIIASIEEAANSIGLDHDGKVLGISAAVTGAGLSDLAKSIRKIATRRGESSTDNLDENDRYVNSAF